MSQFEEICAPSRPTALPRLLSKAKGYRKISSIHARCAPFGLGSLSSTCKTRTVPAGGLEPKMFLGSKHTIQKLRGTRYARAQGLTWPASWFLGLRYPHDFVYSQLEQVTRRRHTTVVVQMLDLVGTDNQPWEKMT